MTEASFSILTAALLGYLLGSIPFGLLLTRAAGLGDIRAIGSGNIGATNVLRTGHKGLAAATLLLDGLKGAAAVYLASIVSPPEALAAPLVAAFAAVIGHTFPVWLNFRGGKGVATYIGVLSAVFWPASVIMCALWIAMALLSRYSSLSALTASVLNPAILYLFGERLAAAVFVALTALLLFKHRDNIRRLLSGEEPKIGAKA